MAYSIELDNVSPETIAGTQHVAYVKVIDIDDSNKVIGTICVSKSSDDNAFQLALETKIKASIARYEAKKAVEASISAALSNLDMAKITTEAVAEKTGITEEPITKEV
jgi:hypothetical protein